MFGQLGNRESLRDLITIIEAHHQKCYHLGLGKHVTRSNLAKANTNRDYRIFAEIELTIYKSQKDYPEHLRLLRFYDEEQQGEFMFLTNATELTALQVADLYKKCHTE